MISKLARILLKINNHPSAYIDLVLLENNMKALFSFNRRHNSLYFPSTSFRMQRRIFLKAFLNPVPLKDEKNHCRSEKK